MKWYLSLICRRNREADFSIGRRIVKGKILFYNYFEFIHKTDRNKGLSAFTSNLCHQRELPRINALNVRLVHRTNFLLRHYGRIKLQGKRNRTIMWNKSDSRQEMSRKMRYPYSLCTETLPASALSTIPTGDCIFFHLIWLYNNLYSTTWFSLCSSSHCCSIIFRIQFQCHVSFFVPMQWVKCSFLKIPIYLKTFL